MSNENRLMVRYKSAKGGEGYRVVSVTEVSTTVAQIIAAGWTVIGIEEVPATVRTSL